MTSGIHTSAGRHRGFARPENPGTPPNSDAPHLLRARRVGARRAILPRPDVAGSPHPDNRTPVSGSSTPLEVAYSGLRHPVRAVTARPTTGR